MTTGTVPNASSGQAAGVPTGDADGGRVAVIDVGSNSVRLVVFSGWGRAPATLFNEKVLCGLGRTLDETGLLNPAAVEHAARTVRRFAALARAMSVAALEIVATAAVREAGNGAAFTAALERDCGAPVRILSGPEEARLSALGVLAAIPRADGLMGDLGGGSLELVRLRRGSAEGSVTLPIGPLRLTGGKGVDGNAGAMRGRIDQALDGAPWLAECRGADLYIVGGAWRALGRIHMQRVNYPLHVLHGYTVDAAELETLALVIAGLGRKSLKRIQGVTRERLDSLPLAALTLARLLRLSGARRAVFSAYGLREGLIFNHLPADRQAEDPLIAACRQAARASRFADHGDELMAWMGPLFPEETEAARRLRLAAAMLSDVYWRLHPDYRGEHALLEILRAPFVGIDHPERVQLALAIHARYAGETDRPLQVAELIDEAARDWARRVGLALRLAQTYSGGVLGLLSRTRLALDGERLRFSLAPEAAALMGDVVARRLDALARAFGRAAAVEVAGSDGGPA